MEPTSREAFERAVLASIAAADVGRREEVGIATGVHSQVAVAHNENRAAVKRARDSTLRDERDDAAAADADELVAVNGDYFPVAHSESSDAKRWVGRG
jgi:hypothetical protein